jgi:hypothetical protein
MTQPLRSKPKKRFMIFFRLTFSDKPIMREEVMERY